MSTNRKTILTRRGYVLNKKDISDEEFKKIKEDLLVTPKINSDYGQEAITYPLYREDKDTVCLPRYYGIETFGQPTESTIVSKDANFKFKGQLREYQQKIVDDCVAKIKSNGGGLISLGCGEGKCHSRDTKILMFDGTIKLVQDVKINDLLMGDDSTPRKVLSLAHGTEEMFDIIPTKGEKYTVNRSHILSLKYNTITPKKINGIKYKKGDVIDISIDDYLKLPPYYHGLGTPLRGYRVPITFPQKDVLIDPYILGYWLGDGTSRRTSITTVNDEVIKYFRKYAEKRNLIFKQNKCDKITYDIIGKIKNRNQLLDAFKKYDLICNKHIPIEYKCNSRQIRLELLAGLMDSDGYMHNNCYEIIQKREKLLDDIIYLARSLGFSAYKSECQKTCTNSKNGPVTGTYYKTMICGDVDQIPVKLAYKKAGKRQQIKDPLVYGITVKSVGQGEYYGFEIDGLSETPQGNSSKRSGYPGGGNHRFLLGDFTVTHNTVIALYISALLQAKTLVIVHKTFLQDQWYERASQFTNAKLGIIRQKKKDVKGKDIVIGMLQSISQIDYDLNIFDDFKLVIVDECHRTGSRIFSNAYWKAGAMFTLGLSATPDRKDGLTKVINWYIGDILYKSKKKQNKNVLVKTFIYKTNNDLFVEKKRWVKGTFVVDFVKMITNLCKIPERNQFIVDIINQIRKYPERKILILSGRIDHLNILKDMVDVAIKEDEKNGIIDAGECKTFYYIGDMKKGERKDAETSGDILFGTYEMAQEGLDIDRLNTIILASPKPDVIQAVGRIMRKIIKEADIKPLIIDIKDDLSKFINHGKKRHDFYKLSKYTINEYYVEKNTIITYKEHLSKGSDFDRELIDLITDKDDYIPDITKILNFDADDADDANACPESPIIVEI